MCLQLSRRLRRWAGLVLLAGSAAGAAGGAGPAAPSLTVGFDRDFPPYEYLDDEGLPAGFDIDLMREVAAAAGLAVDFRPGHGPDLVAALAAGRVQALAGVFRFAKYERTLAFGAFPSEVEFAIVTRAGAPAIQSPDAMAGKDVLVVRGDAVDEWLQARALPFRATAVGSPAEALRRLAAGEADCTMMARAEAAYLIGKLTIPGLAVSRVPIYLRPFGPAVRAGDTELLARLDRGVADLKASGEYQRLHAKWFALLEPRRTMLAWVFRHGVLFVAPLFVLLLAAVAWSRTLARRVEERTRRLRAELSERARVEEALRESEQRFRALADIVPFGILIVQDETIVYANRAAAQILGATADEITGGSPWPFVHPDFVELVKARAADRLAGDKSLPDRYEIKIVNRAGAERWIEMAVTLTNFAGRPATVMAITDVHERRRAQEVEAAIYEISRAAGASENLQELFASLHRTVARLMPATNFYIALYDAARDLLAFPYFVDEVDAKPEPLKPGRGLTGYVLRTGEPLLATDEAVAALEQGGEMESLGAPSVDWLGVPLKAGGVTIGVLAVQSYTGTVRYTEADRQILSYVSIQAAHAIERRRAEDELQESQRQLSTLMSNLPGMAYRCADSSHRTMEFVSEGCAALTGYQPADLVADRVTSYEELIVPADRDLVRRAVDEATAARRPFEVSYRIRTAAGEERWVWERGQGVWSDSGELTALEGFVADLTERRGLEDQLRQAQKIEAVGRLAGGIAHDFNNLLTAVLGSTELLQRRLAGDDGAQHELATIHRAALRAAEFTTGLLAFARRQVLEPVRLDLNAFVAEALPMLRHLIPENIRIDFRPATETDVVQADQGQLTQILMNLCVNARDAMPGGGTIAIETCNAVMDAAFVAAHLGAREGRYVCLRVADTGVGIAEENLARIFEPFFTTKGPGKGTGLGLSTVYGIVKQHEGFILAGSGPGRGSSFTVYLPAAAGHGVPPPPRRQAAVRGGSEVILVVEDEPEVRQVLVEALTGLGYQVHEAADGAAALDMLRRGLAVGLVLTDVVMPHMGGMELCEAARAATPGLRFLFSSGYAEDAVHVGFVKKEGIFFLAKPYGIDALARKVREALDAPTATPAS
ncbi:MAG: transporter substrate-binding domain-containing protein [Acidobacteria bacterium]|nr:MAG: transporter substrate-binding domain-containing protein [Acidobacteriota bacterium]